MDACSLGNVPRVADHLDTGLATSLLVWQSTVSLCLPGILTYGTPYTLADENAGPQLPGQGSPSACQMSLLIGRARAGNLTTPRQIWRWNAQTFKCFQGHPVQPVPDRRSEWASQRFQAPAWKASALESAKRPSSKAGRSLARGPLEEVQHPVRGLASVAGCSCQSGRNTADIHTHTV